MSSHDRLTPWSGTGSWVTGHAGHGSAEWWVTWVMYGRAHVHGPSLMLNCDWVRLEIRDALQKRHRRHEINASL